MEEAKPKTKDERACAHRRQTLELPCPYPNCEKGTEKALLVVNVKKASGNVRMKLRKVQLQPTQKPGTIPLPSIWAWRPIR